MNKKNNLQISVAFLAVCFFIACNSFAQEAKQESDEKPKSAETAEAAPVKISTKDFVSIFNDDFEANIDNWELMDDGWNNVRSGRSKVLSLHKKKSDLKPTFRSPTHLAILKGNEVTSFQLDVRVQSTHEDYGHRDVCFFFGYQSPTEYYYVHLGKKMDPKCNQIFIVNNAERKKISLMTTPGTNWDRRWHDVRVQRDIETGEIQVFFGDMGKPVMTAKDKTFKHGRIGLGSFDDTANFDNFKLTGVQHSKKADTPDEKAKIGPVESGKTKGLN